MVPIKEALKASPAFGSLPDNVIEQITTVAHWRHVAKGHVLFREGDPVDAVYVVGRGRVKITTTSVEGKEQLLHLLGPGDVFPRVGLFRTGAYPATAVADAPSAIAVIHRAALMELAQERGEVAIALLAMMDEVIRSLHQRIRSLALADVKARVQQLLLTGTGRPLTHQEIAAFVGAARETVTRAIAELRREGIILPRARGRGKTEP